tara:strand:- start:13723 stop:14178 length:456 start_codon:yes stop_codon:yes gene_type:complete
MIKYSKIYIIKLLGRGLFAVGVFLTLFFSWRTSPHVTELSLIPDWLSNWTDHSSNGQKRTAVPFIGLGLLMGVYIPLIKKSNIKIWVFAWIVLSLIVAIAEAGQYFLPKRVVDMGDIAWGTIGGAIGLTVSYLAHTLFCRIKKYQFGKRRD